jgi:uncharacterized membrane protein/ElaB/YqjD/DUF883 family membrane-anchored ribosome-binding protein
MGDLSVVVLTANSKDGAAKALDMVKGLDRDGWIDLIDYSIVRKDEKGHVTEREMEDERIEKVSAAAVGIVSGVAGATLGGPAGAAAGFAGGVLAGAGAAKLMDKIVHDTSVGGLRQNLEPDSSRLAVIVEDRHAERLDEELQKLGSTVRRELKRAERDAEFEAYLQRSRDKIRSIQDDIQNQLAKAQTAAAAERAKIEADIAVKRTELEALREKLEDRIKAMNTDLKSEIRDMNFRLELAGLQARSGIAISIDNLHRQLNHFNDELEDVIEHKIDTLKAEASELKMRAMKASGETKVAIENHLLAVESRLHREHAKLQDSFEERLLQMKQWFETLHVQATLLQADMRDRVEAAIDAAQHSFAALKARVRTRKREDERARADIRAGFKKAANELEDAFDQARHERV